MNISMSDFVTLNSSYWMLVSYCQKKKKKAHTYLCSYNGLMTRLGLGAKFASKLNL